MKCDFPSRLSVVLNWTDVGSQWQYYFNDHISPAWQNSQQMQDATLDVTYLQSPGNWYFEIQNNVYRSVLALDTKWPRHTAGS